MGAIPIPHKATLRIYNSSGYGILYEENFRGSSISALLKLIQSNLIEQLKIYSPEIRRGLKYSIEMQQI